MSVLSIILRFLKIRKLGISLVEILVYTTVFSIASIGIFSLLIGFKGSWININTNINQAEQADYATKYIQTQLGRSDSVSIDHVKLGDQACLLLRQNNPVQRSGTVFDGSSRYIGSGSSAPMLAGSSLTVSFWLRVDSQQQGIANIMNWGNASHKRQFAAQLNNGVFLLDFGGATFALSNGKDLRDSKWHHVAITYDSQNLVPPLPGNSIRVYIDNALQTGEYISVRQPDFSKLQTAAGTRLYVGSLRLETANRLNGAVSDLRIWQKSLSAEDITKLATGPASVDVHSTLLQYHWPLQIVGKGQSRFVGIGPRQWVGLFHGKWLDNRIVTTTNETSKITHFCFFDQNNDGLYELWASQAVAEIPKTGPTEPDWERIGGDIFVPKDGGTFFQAISKSPDSVTANFALGSDRYGAPADQKKNQTSSFSTKVNYKSKALCRVVKSDLMQGNCRFFAAFAKIDSNYDKGNESLGIFNATKATDAVTGMITYTNIPYANSQLRGEWNSERGYLRIFNQDGSTLAIKDWNRIFREITYLPKASSYKSDRLVTFSLGDLAFHNDQGFRFYDFHKSTKSPYKYADAVTETASLPDSKCGLKPYVATITSAKEQDFIQQKMHYSSVYSGWQSGWLGAIGSTEKIWSWDSGPEKGQKFWSGGPFDMGFRKSDDAKISVITVKPAQVNPLYSRVDDRIAFRRKVDIWASQNDEFHYTNFSFGIEGRLDCSNQTGHRYCQPWQSYGDNRLATFGGYGQGLWFVARDGLYSCVGPTINSICGHYVEWGGHANDPDITIAQRTTIDVGNHREYCQLE